MSANFTIKDIVSDDSGVASFDAAAGSYYVPPPARNVVRDFMWRLYGALESASLGAAVCSGQCNEKAFDTLRKNLDTVLRILDLERIQSEIHAILKECRDVSYEREESLRRQLYDAGDAVRELRHELDELKRQTYLFGRIQEDSWPDSAQDPI
ncbi:hypothetical protein [Dyella nitratireducens]|nr:hypothetical protein [Dyella nitratireducens]